MDKKNNRKKILNKFINILDFLSDFIGIFGLLRMGAFARWLLTGAKGKFKDFYNKSHTGTLYQVIDYFIGAVVFFIIMYIVIVI
ncbi:MAG TPA: hypothetical protein VNG53_10380 [Bacteroidia bacterium]|nr:hypothetical protein [Bacteroidia bacterium]